MIDADQLKAFTRERTEAICRQFFPNGKKVGREWKIGDSSGKEGNSLGIELEGNKAGLCIDRAGGFEGDLIKLIGENRGLKYHQVADEIGRAFGVSFSLNGAPDFDWGKLEKLNSAYQTRLAKWRAFRPEFVQELVTHDLVRLFTYRNRLWWAFPIHSGGRIGGCHFRPLNVDEGKRVDWEVHPKKENGGPGMQPLVIGNLQKALRVHIAESTWDTLALCDSLGIDLARAGEDVVLCTRGAENGKFVGQIPEGIPAVYVWPQNDDAGQRWLRKVSESLKRPSYRVQVPEQHKDLNDWVKAGASSEELHDAIETAETLETQRALPCAEKPAEENSETPEEHERPWIAESLVSLSRCEIDQSQILLGYRWLERAQGAFWVGPSGIGKSVALIQLALMIGAGRMAFGIPVSGALKILITQSEDSRNDRIEMAQMLPALGLSEQEQEMAHHNVRIASVRGVAGQNFLRQLDHTLQAYELEDWRADIIIINPLTAYLGGDETKPEVCTAFFRVGLDPILSRHNCAALIAHHPPKTSQNPTDKFRYFDWQYRMAGSHHLTNWARATVGIEPTDQEGGVFRFIAGKRGEKIGWEGRETYHAHSQTKGQLLWVPASATQIQQAKTSSPKSVNLERVLELVPVLDPKLTDTLLNEIKGKCSVGRDKAQAALRELEANGRIFNRPIPNPTTGRRSFRGYAKTPEPEGEIPTSHD